MTIIPSALQFCVAAGPAHMQHLPTRCMLLVALLLAVACTSSSTAAAAAPAQQQPGVSNSTAVLPMHRRHNKSQCMERPHTSAACSTSLGPYCARCNKAATTCLCCKAGAALLPDGTCQACPEGTYSAAPGAAACTPCAEGYTTLNTGCSSSVCPGELISQLQ